MTADHIRPKSLIVTSEGLANLFIASGVYVKEPVFHKEYPFFTRNKVLLPVAVWLLILPILCPRLYPTA